MSSACLSENGGTGSGGDAPPESIVHATCVAWQRRGALIRGAAGSGKSGLALSLMALGCDLVADDRVVLRRVAADVMADAPDPIRGLIEARGIGLLRATAVGPVPVYLAIDLDLTETDRLPQARETVLLGRAVPLLRAVAAPHFAPGVLQFLKAGRRDNI